MNVTIFDVAEVAGVSKATVSRVFTNPEAVNPDTRKRILAAAEDLGYRPNAIARAMITKRTGNFSFIIYGEQAPVITNPFYGPILESVVKAASDIGHSLFIASDEELKTDSGELMLQKQVDGIIFSSQPNEELVKGARIRNIPIVMINNVTDRHSAYCLLCDDHSGITQAVEHLIGLGHRRIAMLGGMFTEFIRTRRMSAYRQTLEKHALPCPEGYVEMVAPTIAQAYEGMRRLLTLAQRPTAVVCMNDTIAIGAIKAALHAGLSVPGQLSVTGFDNSAYCAVSEPELTSVDPNPAELGRRAVEYLYAKISGAPISEQAVTLPARLVVRGSSGEAPK